MQYLFLLIVVCIVVRLANGKKNVARKADGRRKLSVVFLHPDLGIGGAERLIVDAAVGLQSLKSKSLSVDVVVYTNHHDPRRCFKETADGTLDVRVVGSWLPRHIRNRGHVFFATLRMAVGALFLCFFGPKCDVYVVDQVAAAMPVLRLLTSRPVFFYCHHPDQLCDPSRVGKSAAQLRQRSLLRRVYRAAFDGFESLSMRAASKVVYNSQFTKDVSLATFPFLAAATSPGCTADILYPPINMERLTTPPPPAALDAVSSDLHSLVARGARLVVSINRYERKKNINLAVAAFAELLHQHQRQRTSGTVDGDDETRPLWLVVAGGYDERLPENKEHHAELVDLARRLGVSHRVLFLRSFSDAEKFVMLRNAACVVYTPEGEHFGIVPIEAMAFGRVVVAVASGGPLESIGRSGEFGLLREPTTEAFAAAIGAAIDDPAVAQRIGEAAAARARSLFGLDAFVKMLASHLVVM